MPTQTQTQTDTKQINVQIRNLKKRKASLEEVMADLNGDAAKTLQASLSKLDSEIAEKENALRQSYPEWGVREQLLEAGAAYAETVKGIFESANIPMKKFPTPREDGSVRNAPEIPGLRQRAEKGGMIFDFSKIKEQISHTFRSGNRVVGILQKSAVQNYDGKPAAGVKISDMIDNLYHVEGHEGTGFYAYLKQNTDGQVQSPSTLFTGKTGGRMVLATNHEDSDEDGEEEVQEEPKTAAAKNGRRSK